MSCHVQSTTVISNTSHMKAADVVWLSNSGIDLPEGCFLDDMIDEAQNALDEDDPSWQIDLPNLDWYGIGSAGTVIDVLLKKIAPHIRGRIEAVLVFDSGDLQGIVIENGVGSLPAVKLVLDHSNVEEFE